MKRCNQRRTETLFPPLIYNKLKREMKGKSQLEEGDEHEHWTMTGVSGEREILENREVRQEHGNDAIRIRAFEAKEYTETFDPLVVFSSLPGKFYVLYQIELVVERNH